MVNLLRFLFEFNVRVPHLGHLLAVELISLPHSLHFTKAIIFIFDILI